MDKDLERTPGETPKPESEALANEQLEEVSGGTPKYTIGFPNTHAGPETTLPH